MTREQRAIAMALRSVTDDRVRRLATLRIIRAIRSSEFGLSLWGWGRLDAGEFFRITEGHDQ